MIILILFVVASVSARAGPISCPAFEPFACPTEQRCIAIQVFHTMGSPPKNPPFFTTRVKNEKKISEDEKYNNNFRNDFNNITLIQGRFT